jgi:hypothetical protein
MPPAANNNQGQGFNVTVGLNAGPLIRGLANLSAGGFKAIGNGIGSALGSALGVSSPAGAIASGVSFAARASGLGDYAAAYGQQTLINSGIPGVSGVASQWQRLYANVNPVTEAGHMLDDITAPFARAGVPLPLQSKQNIFSALKMQVKAVTEDQIENSKKVVVGDGQNLRDAVDRASVEGGADSNTGIKALDAIVDKLIEGLSKIVEGSRSHERR